jgi:hypothetical protein
MMEEKQEKVLPNRAEIRHMLKTGKTSDGHPVYEGDLKLLQPARLFHLKQLGDEANVANTKLKEYVDMIQDKRDQTLITLLGFLTEKKIIDPTEYAEYCERARTEFEEMVKVALENKAKMDAEKVTPAPAAQ